MPPTRQWMMPADTRPSIPIPDTLPVTIDVWRASLARTDAGLDRLARCLDADEERRAARFHAHRDCCRFRAARGLLRHILAPYVDTAPEGIVFDYEPHGKPLLAGHPDVHFNLSHTADVLVVGVARGRRLGIDVEQIIPRTVMSEVMETVSSDPERALLDRLPAAVRGERFTGLWTRKEAYIKADGRGMTLDLKRVDVLTLPMRVRLQGQDTTEWRPCPRWTVRDLGMGPGLAAAVVAEGECWRTVHFEWPADGR